MTQVAILGANGSVTYRDETAQEATARAQREATQGALQTAIGNNLDRIRALGIVAAKYAKNPAGNPALTTRQTHELLARLALAESADDQ